MNHDMVDPEMLDAFDVFKVGIRFDGLPVLSRDGRMPIDETVVWMVDAPGEETTVGELSKLTDFEWVAEPQVWVAPKSMQAASHMVVEPTMDPLEGMNDLSDEDAFNNRMAMEAGMYKKRMGMYAGMHSGVYDTMDEEFQAGNNGTYSASYVGMDEDAFNNRMAMEAGMYSNMDDATYEDMYKKRVMNDMSMRRMPMQSAVMEPEVVDPLAGMPMPGTPAFDQVQEAVQLNDVEQIEIVQAIETAEDRIGQLEGLIAQSLLSTVTDHMFDGETAVVASAAFVASIGDSNSDEIFAKLAALPKDLPVDLMTRVDSVIERLTAIEEQVSKMMLDDVSDEELPQGSGTDFVDETVVNVDDPMGKKKLKP